MVVAAVRFMRTIISRNVSFMDFEVFPLLLLEIGSSIEVMHYYHG